ncbi:hypothetical protein PoB_005636600 [Plakobranchus ocellatus]|uniref:Uncharacterized protein n=1 Tax=Plakobranchus ocellatus TaxID=259542 RepID=A0AAV4C3D8_9GAST|nr:hypothetical protein PoB_005636600 [Plakobranchus ocellatus]
MIQYILLKVRIQYIIRKIRIQYIIRKVRIQYIIRKVRIQYIVRKDWLISKQDNSKFTLQLWILLSKHVCTHPLVLCYSLFYFLSSSGRGVGGTVANEPALDLQESFCHGFEPHHRCPGRTESPKALDHLVVDWLLYAKPFFFLSWHDLGKAIMLQLRPHANDFVSHARMGDERKD